MLHHYVFAVAQNGQKKHWLLRGLLTLLATTVDSPSYLEREGLARDTELVVIKVVIFKVFYSVNNYKSVSNTSHNMNYLMTCKWNI